MADAKGHALSRMHSVHHEVDQCDKFSRKNDEAVGNRDERTSMQNERSDVSGLGIDNCALKERPQTA